MRSRSPLFRFAMTVLAAVSLLFTSAVVLFIVLVALSPGLKFGNK